MKQYLTLALCCAFAHTAFLYSNNEAETTFRSVIAKVILDHQTKFNPDVIAKAKTYDTTKGYIELLSTSNTLKKNQELMASLNAQLKKGMDIMESAISDDESTRQNMIKLMVQFNDEDMTKNHLHKAFSDKNFTQEDVAIIDQALTQEAAPAQA